MSLNGTTSTNGTAESHGATLDEAAPTGPLPPPSDVAIATTPPYLEPQLSYYKRGLFCALDPLTSSTQRLTDELKQLHAELEAAIAAEQLASDEKIKAADEAIDRIIEGLKTLETTPAPGTESTATATLLGDRQRLEREIADVRSRLYAQQQQLVAARKARLPEVVSETVDLLSGESDAIINHALELQKKRREAAQEGFDASTATRQERVTRLAATHEALTASSTALRHLRARLSAAGFTREVVAVLKFAGTAGLFVSGWFFSVFIANSGFDNADYVSFFAGRVVTALDSTFKMGTDRSVLLLIHIAAWTGLLASVWGVGWLTEWSLGTRDESVTTFSEDSIVVLHKQRRTFFPPWIRSTPLVYIAGIVVLLLAFFGPQGDDLDSLLKSLSGQPLGVALGIMVTGGMLLYVTTVVEPRFRRTESLSSGYRDHIEAIVALASPLAIGVVTILLIAVKAPGNLALPWFLSALLLTAATLGYGIWASGIYAADDRASEQLRQIAIHRENLLSPQGAGISLILGDEFQQAWGKRYEALLNGLALGRTAPISSDRTGAAGWLTADHSMFDRLHLPDLRQSVDDLARDLSRLESERDALLRDRKGDNVTPERLRSSLTELRDKRSELLVKADRAIDGVRLDYVKRENAFRDGFNLGLWYSRVDDTGFRRGLA